jgi:hypothetical protein
LVIAPSSASQDQSIYHNAAAFNKPCIQNSSNTPASTHSWKRRWAELLEQMPVPFKALGWQSVRKKNRMAFMAAR